MTATTQTAGLDDDTRRLIDAVVRDLVAAQAPAGSRDVGPDGPRPDGGAARPSTDQEAQRFFGGLVESLVKVVVPKVTPFLLNLLQQRRRELGMPEQRDSAGVERDLQTILQALMPTLLNALPGIATAISGQPAPRDPQEESQRFLPILGALIPALISAVPSIVGLFNQQRGADATPPPLSDPDVAQRFIGPLLSTFVPQLLQAAPGILGAIFGGRRDVAASTW